MSKTTSKTAAPKPGAAVVVPPPELGEAAVTAPVAPVVVLIDRDTLRHALERIAHGRLCGCKGDHDPLQFDCPKAIARAALEAP